MTALVVLVDGWNTVGVEVDAGRWLHHVAQLATFVERRIEIHAFDASGAKWKGRGQR